ncbi:MAG TPA: ADP-glyceromanno-heptose 6-epimerase [Dongiaceae bacterium]|jgi:ADP-L-glycero-D-manno-heptose 6-epimerase|nr:ADP-glyceromanno-heptose 6-epimerase [Dongiaceae bacterium]
MKPLEDCRVLVTGGAGFIGSALVWELNRRGCARVVVADFLGQTEKWRNLTPLRFEDYLEADDLRPRLQAGALGEFDLVLHLGACSATTERDAAYLIRNNFEFTKDLAAWALLQDTRFVYASSAATYGDGAAGMEDAAEFLDRFRPLNAYGYSKQIFDQYAHARGWLPRLVGLKYFNIFGPNEDHKADMRSVVHKSYAQVLESGVIRLFKSHRPDYQDGEQKRDFLYVKDAVAMTLHLATSESAGGLYNIGSGEAHTWNELAQAIFAALDRPASIEYIEMPASLREKYQYYTRANIGKLRATGYAAPVTPLAAAVKDYVTGYLAGDCRLGDEPAKK